MNKKAAKGHTPKATITPVMSKLVAGLRVERRKSPNVLAVYLTSAFNWSQKILILSDVHFDSLHSRRSQLRKLLDQALADNCPIIVTGDFFDVMQGPKDPRGSLGDVDPQYLDDDYFGRVLDEAEEFWRPYAHLILFLGEGNHETSVQKHYGLNLLAILCKRLDVIHLGYSGWVQFFFTKAAGGGRTSRTLWFHHGGMGGEVTQGIGWAHKTQSYIHDVDIYVSGHRHSSWRTELQRMRLTQDGREYQDTALHISVPGMKDEYNPRGGWHVQKGRTPRPTGGFWLVFWWDSDKPGCIALDAHRAY